MICNCTNECFETGECPVALPPPRPDDTQPIQLIVCEHTDSPYCPACAEGYR